MHSYDFVAPDICTSVTASEEQEAILDLSKSIYTKQSMRQ
jgi:hypothetical protein